MLEGKLQKTENVIKSIYKLQKRINSDDKRYLIQALIALQIPISIEEDPSNPETIINDNYMCSIVELISESYNEITEENIDTKILEIKKHLENNTPPNYRFRKGPNDILRVSISYINNSLSNKDLIILGEKIEKNIEKRYKNLGHNPKKFDLKYKNILFRSEYFVITEVID